ncbi:uncharacterized protein LOC133891169 [Phragmites australis]|uniref:uncharacterized protein LOC133891169 n=1 Tax=Phragmites australis TaxID=29695 RepID=UPI002D7A318A|nr:uncharacterized protein LOC133891169 [Phragmites australis]
MDHRPPLDVSPRRLRPRPHRVQRPPLAPSSSVKTPPGSIKKAATPMRASTCAIPSPIRLEPSPMRASISALPVPRLEPSLPRTKLDFPAAAAPSPARATGKENLPATELSPPARAARKENLPAGVDHDERVALDLAALARAASPVAGPLFVRGRLYDLYSARRNERLKRKHGFPYGGDWEAVDAEVMAEDPCVAVELSKRRVANKASTGAGAESVRRSMPAGDFAVGRAKGLAPRSSLRASKEMKKATAASGSVSLVKERTINSRSSARRM